MKRENLKLAQETDQELEKLENEIRFLQDLINKILVDWAREAKSEAKVTPNEVGTEWMLRYILAQKETRRDELLSYMEKL